MLTLTGCPHSPYGNDSIPAVGSSIDKAHSHVDSAENAVQHAKPHSDKTGKEILDIASDEHSKADKELDMAKKQVADVQKESQAKDGVIAKQAAEISKVEHGWGYRLQQLVAHLIRLLVILLALHVLLAGAGWIITLFFPAALVAVPVISTIAKIINPAGWFTWLAAHAHHVAVCSETQAPIPGPPAVPH